MNKKSPEEKSLPLLIPRSRYVFFVCVWVTNSNNAENHNYYKVCHDYLFDTLNGFVSSNY